jgi:hypothetical protein
MIVDRRFVESGSPDPGHDEKWITLQLADRHTVGQRIY